MSTTSRRHRFVPIFFALAAAVGLSSCHSPPRPTVPGYGYDRNPVDDRRHADSKEFRPERRASY
jgi:hypothetical protein